MRIAFIDDDTFANKIYGTVLRQNGTITAIDSFDTYLSPHAFFDAATEQDYYDVVISDLNLKNQEFDGVDLLSTYETKADKEVTLILLTGDTSQELQHRLSSYPKVREAKRIVLT
jgi:DNA-binding response OmpR family regulator